MAKERVLLAPDDIQTGMFAMVHHGADAVASQIIPGGIVLTREVEVHGDVKGQPFAVMSVCHPYVVGSLVPSGCMRVFDLRTVQLMRVNDGYVKVFEAMGHQAPRDSDDGPQLGEPGDADGGVTAEIGQS